MPHNIDNFYDAYHFLHDHPHFFYKGKMWDHNEPGFEDNLTIMVVKVNPENNRIEDDDSLNTKTMVWLECGGYSDITSHEMEIADSKSLLSGWRTHDWDLDCGADTFEDAIMALAKDVMEKYGDYPPYTICSHCLKNRPCEEGRDENEEWFCSDLCKEHGSYEIETEPTGHGTFKMVKTKLNNNCREHFGEDRYSLKGTE